jgi:hypothetical protein
MRRILLAGVAVVVTACGVQEMFTGDAGAVARTATAELRRDTLAAIMVGGKNVPLEREMVERWAFRWVEFSLFAERLAAGDSLLDSATVIAAMWPEANQWLVNAFHEQLANERVHVDSAVVDSAYAVGDHRLIQHILIRTTPDMSPPARTTAERRAEAIRARLAAGGSWEAENEQSDDPVAKQEGGSLGVIVRGQRPKAFDDAAFALAPGELSRPVATQYGLHIIRRPPLDEVRDAYTAAVTEILTARMREDYLGELDTLRNLRVRSNGPALMREAAQAPLRTYQSPRVIGTYRGGEFTTADFVHWLQALRSDVAQSVPGASDDQLEELARSLIRNETLIREAREAGMVLTADDMRDLRERLREEIDRVTSTVGLDSAMAGLPTVEERQAAGEAAIRDYFHRISGRLSTVVVVPPFLAEMLRSTMEWDVSQPGVDQTLELATRLREERLEPEGVAPQTPAPQTPVPDTTGGSGAR